MSNSSRTQPSDHYNSFVGIWKRMFFNGQAETDGPIIGLAHNRTFFAEFPGGDDLVGEVKKVVPAKDPNHGNIVLDTTDTRVITRFNYSLNGNNSFKSHYEASPKHPNPPAKNELRLWIQGVDQLFAFVKVLSFRPGPGPNPGPDFDQELLDFFTENDINIDPWLELINGDKDDDDQE